MAEEMESAAEFAQRIPPYVSYRSMMTMWVDLAKDGIPPRIDRSVLRKFSGGLGGQILSGLKALNLMNDQGVPTPQLHSLISTLDKDSFPAELRALLRPAYPFLDAIDLETATPSMFAEAFKKGTNAKEDVLRKCRTFFLHAAKDAGIKIGPRIEKGSYARPTGSGPKAKRRSKAEAAESRKDADQQAVVDKFYEPIQQEKPLEYQLIDLMKEPDIDAEVRQSIWALVQYLTARSVRNQGAK